MARSAGGSPAILNREHIERYQRRRGFFGFFECRDDQEAANGCSTRQGWFEERESHCLRGPINPSLNYHLGLLVEGFDSRRRS